MFSRTAASSLKTAARRSTQVANKNGRTRLLSSVEAAATPKSAANAGSSSGSGAGAGTVASEASSSIPPPYWGSWCGRGKQNWNPEEMMKGPQEYYHMNRGIMTPGKVAGVAFVSGGVGYWMGKNRYYRDYYYHNHHRFYPAAPAWGNQSYGGEQWNYQAGPPPPMMRYRSNQSSNNFNNHQQQQQWNEAQQINNQGGRGGQVPAHVGQNSQQ